MRHAIRFGVALAVGVAIYRLTGFDDHGYWIPLTTLFVLRPSRGETFERIPMRAAGTIGRPRDRDRPRRAARQRPRDHGDRPRRGDCGRLRAACDRVRGLHDRDHGLRRPPHRHARNAGRSRQRASGRSGPPSGSRSPASPSSSTASGPSPPPPRPRPKPKRGLTPFRNLRRAGADAHVRPAVWAQAPSNRRRCRPRLSQLGTGSPIRPR